MSAGGRSNGVSDGERRDGEEGEGEGVRRLEETRRLARFCRGLRWDGLPEDVRKRARICVLDFAANVYGSLELAEVRAVAEYVRSLRAAPEAAALACGYRTAAPLAALVNGTLAESIEAQDGLRYGGNHPVSAVMPAALAVAEAEGRTGREFLEALVAGYEVANRIASSVHPLHTLSGFLPTGTCGAFGAAAAAARLLGLDEEGMTNALGIAGYLAPISMAEVLMGGFTAKILQGGQGALAGVVSAYLARAGVSGPPYVLEGSELKGGFTQITVRGEPNLEKITEGLGERYTITDMYLKPYSACRHTHGAIQAVLEILGDGDVQAGEVDKVEVFTYAMAVVAVGKGLGDNESFVSAQFSIPYVVAAALLDRELGPRQLTAERRADPALRELMSRVEVKLDEELQKVYPEKTASRVELVLRDGTRLVRQVDIPKGDPRDPMEEEDVKEKLLRFAGSRDRGRLEELCGTIRRMEEVADIGRLVELF